jgi:hypothetical protein
VPTVSVVVAALVCGAVLGIMGPATSWWQHAQRFSDFGDSLPAPTLFCLDFRAELLGAAALLGFAGAVGSWKLRSAVPAGLSAAALIVLGVLWGLAMSFPIMWTAGAIR